MKFLKRKLLLFGISEFTRIKTPFYHTQFTEKQNITKIKLALLMFYRFQHINLFCNVK